MMKSVQTYFSVKRKCLLLVLFCFAISIIVTSCREEKISSDPALRLTFSADTVRFDTVFTSFGSSTRAVMVYNPNRNAVNIQSVSVSTDRFQLNLDGENDRNRLNNIILNGGDSLFLFVRATIDPQDVNSPVFLTDSVCFLVNGNTQRIILEAYGQNVRVIRSSSRRTQMADFRFTSDKPYLIFDTLDLAGVTVMDAGAVLYMHDGTSLFLYGPVRARGTLEKPVRITGDRLDKLFPKVSYQKASGQWGGVYLLSAEGGVPLAADTLNYVEILSGNVGLYSYSAEVSSPRKVVISNALIHNHARYGVVLLNTDATVCNSEISNCASYCMFLSGGNSLFVHNTIASFFGYPYTNLNIHTTGREDVPAVYINLIDSTSTPASVRMYNNIITGARANSLVFDTIMESGFDGEFANNYLLADTIKAPWCHDNVYAAENDTVFVNTRYLYKEYNYYDFRLDSISPARGIGSEKYALPYPYDRLGFPRQPPVDAGCYQWH